MILLFLGMLFAIYVGVGLFLETDKGEFISTLLILIVSLPVLFVYGVYKLIRRK